MPLDMEPKYAKMVVMEQPTNTTAICDTCNQVIFPSKEGPWLHRNAPIFGGPHPAAPKTPAL